MNRRLRAALGALLIGACGIAYAAADVVAGTTELGRLLNAGRSVAVLEPVAIERGCGPSGCVVTLDTITVHQPGGPLGRADGSAIRLIQHAPGDPKSLPAMNWDPLQAFRVVAGGKGWGTCIEFAHAGLGNSGSFQRWRTVVLVPADNGARLAAHRYVGYWASCDQLTVAAGVGNGAGAAGAHVAGIVLPLIEPIAVRQAPLHLVWVRCSAGACSTSADRRVVRREQTVADGAISIATPQDARR